MTVGVAEERAHLPRRFNWRSQEGGASAPEGVVRRATVRYPEGHLVAYARGVAGRLEGDVGFVRGGRTAGDEEKPRAQQLEHTRGSAVLSIDSRSHNIAIEVPGRVDVADDQEMRQLDSVGGEGQLRLLVLRRPDTVQAASPHPHAIRR